MLKFLLIEFFGASEPPDTFTHSSGLTSFRYSPPYNPFVTGFRRGRIPTRRKSGLSLTPPQVAIIAFVSIFSLFLYFLNVFSILS